MGVPVSIPAVQSNQSPVFSGYFLTSKRTFFGEHTKQGEGAYPVSASSIISGDPSGYFEVVGGALQVSAAGVGNISGSYNLVFNDLSTLQVDIAANTYSVSNATELEDAAIDAHANHNAADSIIEYRVYGDYGKADTKNGSYITFQNQSFAGSLVVSSDSKSGQHLTYIRVINCVRVVLENAGGNNVADEDSWIIDETHPSGSGHPDAYYTIPCETTYQIQFSGCSYCGVRRSRFGNKQVDDNPRRSVTCIYVAICGPGMFFEDNVYDGYYRALKVIRTQGFESRRNLYLNALSDSVFCSTTQSVYVTGPVVCVVEFETMINPWNVYDFKDAHIDAVQIGTGSDEESYDVAITGIYQDQTGEYVRSQGIWMDDSPAGVEINGFVRGCFIRVTSRSGIGVWRSTGFLVEQNTLLRANTDTEKSWVRCTNTVDAVIRNNICGSVNTNVDNTGATETNNIPVDHLASSGPESYAELFNLEDYTNKVDGPAWGSDAGFHGHSDFKQQKYAA